MTIASSPRLGTCAFRLMPDDSLAEADSTAELTRIGPAVVSLAYTWVHPADGPQRGVLLVGGGPEGQGPGEETATEGGVDITAAWADSWHQQPGLRTLRGTRAGGRAEVQATYAGDWGWVVVLDGLDALDGLGGDDELTMVMRNVVPPSAAEMLPEGAEAGAYDVMVARWGAHGGR